MTNPNDLAYPSYQEGYAPQRGLTKRELFAAMAMQATLSNPHTAAQNEEGLNALPGVVSICAIEIADALIEALNQ